MRAVAARVEEARAASGTPRRRRERKPGEVVSLGDAAAWYHTVSEAAHESKLELPACNAIDDGTRVAVRAEGERDAIRHPSKPGGTRR